MKRVTVGEQGLVTDGQTLPVYAGSVQYWRLERERWPLILDRVRELGFGVIETYIPWSVHETSPGQFDWGQVDPRRDVEAFLRLCQARAIRVLARPGPLINAEMTDFGFPEWVLLDPDVQAHTALGTLHLDAAWGLHPPRVFPVPSYASERFLSYVGGWFDAVCPILARHLAPDGCVAAVQSDNETCYLFFDQPYATDYSPDSLALYRAFLRQRHATIDALNALYGTRFAAFEAVDPPRDGPIASRKDAPWHVDWIAYKEHQIIWSVARIARMLRERGLGSVPIFHDVAFSYTTPLDIARMEADPDIDWVGLNLYRPPWEHRQLADRVRFLAGSTRLPFVPELGAGLWSHHPVTPTPAEHEFVSLSVLMYGIKAFNFYMLAERERWQGSPITRHGSLRADHAPFYSRLMRFLDEWQFWRFRRRPPVLVLLSYDAGRFKASNTTWSHGHVDLLRLPAALFESDSRLDLPLLDAVDGWLQQVTADLRRRSIDYDLADTHVDAERLRRYDVVIVQSGEVMAEHDQRTLQAFARAGGRLLIGPGVPSLDEYLRPCSILTAASRDLAIDVRVEFAIDPPAEIVAHHDADRTLLFISNPTPEPIDIRLGAPDTLRPVWTNTPRRAPTHLESYTVEIWSTSR